ncbi:MAG: arsenate reductase ArsC [Syntrophaceae bacterium]|nr:arsenate reductase ArsC [Syntrophaceae bacterium]
MKATAERKSVLFVCTHNAVRSQMAEAFLRHLFGDRYLVASAGSDPQKVDPLVLQVLHEAGIDASRQKAKGLDIYQNEYFDAVVTVCDKARESCPYFPHTARHIHKSFTDPSLFCGKPEEIIDEYRRIRNEIRSWVEKVFRREAWNDEKN